MIASPFWPFSQEKVYVFLLLLLCCLSCFHATLTKKSGNSSDELALLSFKSLITHDPHGSLSSWGNNSIHFCKWNGVTCTRKGHKLKVMALDLQALDLAGSISPSLGNLTYLKSLQLQENLLSSSIPEKLGLLSNLHHLNLSYNLLEGMIPHTLSQCFNLQTISLMNNSLHGEIPSNLSHCSDLQIIDFRDNFFSGVIPASLGELNNLNQLLLFNNLLEAKGVSDWAFLVALANCSNLQILSLSRNRLGGAFPSSIGNLSSGLQILGMHDNLLKGAIPQKIGDLHSLSNLFLGSNNLEGIIPNSLWNLSFLQYLSMEQNNLSGVIHPSIGQTLPNLISLILDKNQFHGPIPTSIGNLSSGLQILGVRNNLIAGSIPSSICRLINLQIMAFGNNLLEGVVPNEIGNLHSLRKLSLGSNNLEGVIPNSIWNLSLLQYLEMEKNNLSGVIPPSIGKTLPNLISLLLYQNQFHGPIPTSLSNCSSLEQIDLDFNDFTGKVPTTLGTLKSLNILNLDANRLKAIESTDWAFIESLTNCTNLETLGLEENEFSGIFPKSIANLSINLEFLTLARNRISGILPPEIKNLIGLSWLDLARNQLTGTIPPTIGSLLSLQMLGLNNNGLYGAIPFTIGNISQLNKLYLENNNLSGYIPKNLGLCKQLEILSIESNMLIGTIPYEITSIPSLTIALSLSNNLLNGSLPSNIGSLMNLVELDVSNNKLSGEIPNNLGQCMELQYLYMNNNDFEGNIPSSLEALRGLEEIDLSHNRLVGGIPKYLVNFSLQYLNLSFNNLEGEVPKSGIFTNASAFSVFGNKQLCGGIPELNLPACFNHSKMKGRSHLIVVVTVLSIVVFFIILIVISIASRKTLSKISPSIWRIRKEQHVRISYAQLLKATNGFSPENLIGTGSFGFVYKGNINSEANYIVAVKVLNLQQHGALKSYEAECNALSGARHRNLVKVLTVCSSIDYGGKNFKALVLEFMCNGSLEKWLHPKWNDGGNKITCLNLIQRLNIAIDVACALDYLHNQVSTQIIHCDLKPSNVLLDEDMVAHVGDFGLAKLLVETTIESEQTLTRSSALRGTIGYVAPEYGMTNQASTQGDVFSFGILLLEVFTGRRPTDAIFTESNCLRNYVQTALPKEALTIIDPKLFSLQGDEEVGNEIQQVKNIRKHEFECVVSVLNIGILCSKESPFERIQIRNALKELHVIKNVFTKHEWV